MSTVKLIIKRNSRESSNTMGANFWMGARKSDGLPYFGLVDELRLYKRGLSQAEVKKNMDAEGLTVQPAQKLALTWGKVKMAK